jgi:uncharacterized protein YndB with AHSA1/START domain
MANPLKMLKLKPAGFQLLNETPLKAPPAKVWKIITNPTSWFGFTPVGEPNNKQSFKLAPGGTWTVTNKDGVQMLLATVTHIEPGKLLRLSGPIGLAHLAISNAIIFELVPQNDGKTTLLRSAHRSFGFITSDIKGNYTGAWKHLLAKLKYAAEK